MAYRLLIEMDIQFASPFKSLLSPGEVIRGEPAKLTFFVTNLGRTVFPGGRVQNWRINLGPEGNTEHTSPTANVQCKPLPPKTKAKLLSEEVVPVTEGLAWVHFSIEPKGEKEATVVYYQSRNERLSAKEWSNCFYVVDRQMVQLNSLIGELIRKLEILKE